MTDAAAGIRRAAQRDVAIGFEQFFGGDAGNIACRCLAIDSGQCGRDSHMQVFGHP